MSTVQLQASQPGRKPPLAKPLDEAVWQAWVAKGRLQDLQGSTRRATAVKWVVPTVLVAAALLSFRVTPYETVVRFVVAAGAMTVMFQAIQTRRYVFAAMFGALVLLFNPILPVLGFSADWQRAIVVASAIPFVASLTWRKVRTPHHD